MRKNDVPIVSDNTQTIDNIIGTGIVGNNLFNCTINICFNIGHSTTGNDSAITGNIEINCLEDLENLIQRFSAINKTLFLPHHENKS